MHNIFQKILIVNIKTNNITGQENFRFYCGFHYAP